MVQTASSDPTALERQGGAHSHNRGTRSSRDAVRCQAHAMPGDSESIRGRPVRQSYRGIDFGLSAQGKSCSLKPMRPWLSNNLRQEKSGTIYVPQ